jgi:hypothetical protein
MAQGNKDKSGSFMTLSIILAVLMIGGAIAYAKLSQDGSISVPLPQVMQSDTVEVPLQMSECSEFDNRCIVVERSCGFCCDFVSINSRFEKQFDNMFNKSCAWYTGEKCNCYDLDRFPKCINNTCQLVDFSEANSK